MLSTCQWRNPSTRTKLIISSSRYYHQSALHGLHLAELRTGRVHKQQGGAASAPGSSMHLHHSDNTCQTSAYEHAVGETERHEFERRAARRLVGVQVREGLAQPVKSRSCAEWFVRIHSCAEWLGSAPAASNDWTSSGRGDRAVQLLVQRLWWFGQPVPG